MATVTMTGVSKFYDKHCVLNQIDLGIERGEFLAVVGPSGCGKSTLLRLVAGLDTVTSGQILINDQCVNKIPASARDMAMVFQSYALYPHMTAYDNMAYGLKMRGMKKKLIRQRVEEVSDLLQIRDYLHRKPVSLSGGQRQRVAMGRAIVRSPAVFLFDEPLSSLDAKLRTEMRYEIKKLHQKLGTTCLYVTHDQTEAMTMADKIVVLNQGVIEQVGTPSALYLEPATCFVASFMGHYPMNFLSGVVDSQQQIVLSDVGVVLPLPTLISPLAQGSGVLVGIRPEHLRLTMKSHTKSMLIRVDFIDDMGADKLLQVLTCSGNLPLSIRVPGDTHWEESGLAVEMDMSKANLYCSDTKKRLGGWSE